MKFRSERAGAKCYGGARERKIRVLVQPFLDVSPLEASAPLPAAVPPSPSLSLQTHRQPRQRRPNSRRRERKKERNVRTNEGRNKGTNINHPLLSSAPRPRRYVSSYSRIILLIMISKYDFISLSLSLPCLVSITDIVTLKDSSLLPENLIRLIVASAPFYNVDEIATVAGLTLYFSTFIGLPNLQDLLLNRWHLSR
jgi:hypothetical protein